MKTDFVITIGGDGTIFRTCLSLPKPEPPILAVNMGVRGFLAETDPSGAIQASDKCLKGEYRLEKCMKLHSTADGITIPDALNDVVVLASERSKLLYAQILKGNELILKCQADGLMASTQTGSTGYSLSTGGPVLDPDIEAFVLAAICPLSAFHPRIFPSNSTLTIEVPRPKIILVLVDGHFQQALSAQKPSVTITRSRNETIFIRFQENFYHRLRNRLLFRGIG